MAVTISGSNGITFPDATSLATAPTLSQDYSLNAIGTYRIGATRTTSNSSAGVTSAGTGIYEPILRTASGVSDLSVYPSVSYDSYSGVWFTGSAFGVGSWRSMNSMVYGIGQQPYKGCVMWVRYA